jgi:hypothetical protein
MSGIGNNLTKGGNEMDDTNSYADEAAKAAAEFVGHCLFHRHRGVLDCNDKAWDQACDLKVAGQL